jgi:hypothetical protein
LWHFFVTTDTLSGKRTPRLARFSSLDEVRFAIRPPSPARADDPFVLFVRILSCQWTFGSSKNNPIFCRFVLGLKPGKAWLQTV